MRGLGSNNGMGRTQRELSFFRDLYIHEDYTRRFTDLADKHFGVDKSERLLYLNAGTGAHCLFLNEQSSGKIEIFGICEDEDQLNIARGKAAAIKAEVAFSTEPEADAAFDTIIADASLTKPETLADLFSVAARHGAEGARVCFLLPSAGSFGEIFSMLWEVLTEEGSAGGGEIAEDLIRGVPTVSRLEEMARDSGFSKISTFVANEVFDYEDGKAFAASPLVADFLVPTWLSRMSAPEMEKVLRKLTTLINNETGDISFRFSVKATVLIGAKE